MAKVARRRHPRPSVPTREKKKTRGFFFGGESESGERVFSAKDAERKKEGVAGAAGGSTHPNSPPLFEKKI